MNNNSFQFEFIKIFFFIMKNFLFKFFSFLFIMCKIFHVFKSKRLSQLDSFLGVWLYTKFFREFQTSMYFHIDKQIVIEDNPSQMDK